jgi:hypothetical protein
MTSNNLAVCSHIILWLTQLCNAALYLIFGYLIHHYIISQGIVGIVWPGSCPESK